MNNSSNPVVEFLGAAFQATLKKWDEAAAAGKENEARDAELRAIQLAAALVREGSSEGQNRNSPESEN